MSEEAQPEEASDAGPVIQSASAGVAIALDRARSRRRKAPKPDAVDRFLDEERGLIGDQRKHIHEQLKHMRVKHFSEMLKVTLQLATLAVGLAIIGIFASMAWSAAHDEGVVVRAFSAPPGYAAKGVTGEGLAQSFLDRLIEIRTTAAAASFVTPLSVRGAREELRVEIPQTGVSIGEVQRFLDERLGRQTIITGEVAELTPGVLTITVRTAGRGAISVSGPAADLDRLMQQAAERAFAAAQPTNWVLYLGAVGRHGEALDEAQDMVRHPEKAAANAGTGVPSGGNFWGLAASHDGDNARALRHIETGAALNSPILALNGLANAQMRMAHDEAALQSFRASVGKSDANEPERLRGAGSARIRQNGRYWIATYLGDHAAAAEAGLRDSRPSYAPWRQTSPRTMALIAAHAPGGRRALADGTELGVLLPLTQAEAQVALDRALGDWPAMLADARLLLTTADTQFQQPTRPGLPPPSVWPDQVVGLADLKRRQYNPLLAEALARTGDVAGARAIAADTPLDCYQCLWTRGVVESAGRDWAAADGWFARAVAAGPSLPQAHLALAQSRLARRDAKGALAALAQASKLGPRFADPLELTGEVLLAQGDAAGAAAKFADAARLAPGWGRLHLKWAQVLAKQGKPDQARAVLTKAAGLELSPVDRAELTGLRL